VRCLRLLVCLTCFPVALGFLGGAAADDNGGTVGAAGARFRPESAFYISGEAASVVADHLPAPSMPSPARKEGQPCFDDLCL